MVCPRLKQDQVTKQLREKTFKRKSTTAYGLMKLCKMIYDTTTA